MADNHRPRKTIKSSLPSDLIFFNILPRLPARCVLRFRSVCKQWHSFLTSPQFLNIHRRHITNDNHQNHHKLLVLSTTTPCNFHTIDCESPEFGLSASRPFPLQVSPENMTIISSFNGLVCVGITKRRYDVYFSDLILWNPLTGDFKRLSKSKEYYEVNARASGLYYSSYDDDYKLLRVNNDHNAYIYSLHSDSWRKLDSTENLERLGYLISETWGPSILQNEKLYFLKKGWIGGVGQLSYSIIKFDTKTEEFTNIATPNIRVGRKAYLNFTLLQKDKKIHLCAIYEESSKDLGAMLWRINGDGDGGWTKVVTYPIILSFNCFQKPLHMMRNGNWLTCCLHSGCHVYKLDLVRHYREISYSNTAHRMDIPPTGKYIETLVSPNR